jgi:hypothetical protein
VAFSSGRSTWCRKDDIMNTDQQPAPDGYDDQCLVHHFIRAHGRRPKPDELRALREEVVVAAGHSREDGPTASTSHHGLRRELARLVHRL